MCPALVESRIAKAKNAFADFHPGLKIVFADFLFSLSLRPKTSSQVLARAGSQRSLTDTAAAPPPPAAAGGEPPLRNGGGKAGENRFGGGGGGKPVLSSPVSTSRLAATRSRPRGRSYVMHIVRAGDVVLEFLKVVVVF